MQSIVWNLTKNQSHYVTEPNFLFGLQGFEVYVLNFDLSGKLVCEKHTSSVGSAATFSHWRRLIVNVL